MMDQFELGVNADVTSAGVDSVLLIAGEAQPNTLGYLRLRLLRFGDDTRGKSLRVNLVGGIKLPRSSVYVKGKVIASSGLSSGVKFKSQVCMAGLVNTFVPFLVECVHLPSRIAAHCLPHSCLEFDCRL